MHPLNEKLVREILHEAFANQLEADIAATTASSVLIVLEVRGLAVMDAQRECVLDCTDTAQLDRWLRQAAIAPSADALFE